MTSSQGTRRPRPPASRIRDRRPDLKLAAELAIGLEAAGVRRIAGVLDPGPPEGSDRWTRSPDLNRWHSILLAIVREIAGIGRRTEPASRSFLPAVTETPPARRLGRTAPPSRRPPHPRRPARPRKPGRPGDRGRRVKGEGWRVECEDRKRPPRPATQTAWSLRRRIGPRRRPADPGHPPAARVDPLPASSPETDRRRRHQRAAGRS